MSSFSFSFAGDDIEDIVEDEGGDSKPPPRSFAAETGTLRRPSSSAFPVAGQPLLPARTHDVTEMLKILPANIAYSTLVIRLDDGREIGIPRRELWDVRGQLMAEEDDEGLGNLGKDDVRTGVYEGGFKSWESSVDVVKVLGSRVEVLQRPAEVLELGCGTALPSMALFQWLLEQQMTSRSQGDGIIGLGLADYNPTVLQLVTLPNLLLSWAKVTSQGAWDSDGELEIDESLVQKFQNSLETFGIAVSFLSGAWSPDFVRLAVERIGTSPARLTILGAETIYSPAALKSFADTLVALLQNMPGPEKTAIVAAKKVYFGVGGSMEDFCDSVRANGMDAKQIREESDGVRRSVVEVTRRVTANS